MTKSNKILRNFEDRNTNIAVLKEVKIAGNGEKDIGSSYIAWGKIDNGKYLRAMETWCEEPLWKIV